MQPQPSWTDLLRDQVSLPSLPGLLVHLLLAALLAFLLGQAYVRFGKTPSNRKAFARNFLLLAMTTALIISIVKSSLALSLGLVGALSIVRFRAAIKDPEELAYLFIAIGIGLGLGAGQAAVTVVAVLLILGLIAARGMAPHRDDAPNMFVSVASSAEARLAPGRIAQVLQDCGLTARVTRIDETAERTEALVEVAMADASKMEEVNTRLRALSAGATIAWVADRGLGA